MAESGNMRLFGIEIRRADRPAAIHVKESSSSSRWIRLGQSGYTLQRDITAMQIYETNDRVYKAWLYNPIVKRITEIWVNYVIGSGLTFEAKDERVQAVLDAFLSQNKVGLKMKKRAREAYLFGELFAVPNVNTISGNVRLGFADPLNIEKVNFDPFDGDTPTSIEIRTVDGRFNLPLVTVDERGDAALRIPEFYGEQRAVIGNKALNTLGMRTGRAMLLQFNTVIGSQRGTTELLPIIDWCAGLEDILWINKQRVEDQSAIVGVITIEGATPKQLNEYRNPESANYIPPPRRFNPNEETSWAYANEKIKFNFISPDIKATDIETFSKVIKSLIQIGSGNPAVVFGQAEEATWASARETMSPFFQMMESGQKQFVQFWEDIAGFAIDQKRIFSSELDGVTDFGVKVKAPPIAVDDKKLIVEIAKGMSEVVAIWRVNNWIDDTQASQLVRTIAAEAKLPIEEVIAPDGNDVKEDWKARELRRIREGK